MKDHLKKCLVLLSVLMLVGGTLTACNGTSKDRKTGSKPHKEPAFFENDDDFYEDDEYYYDDDFYEDDEYYDDDFYEEDEYYDDEDFYEKEDDGLPEKKGSKKDSRADSSPVGKWYTEDYDENDNWANSYVIELMKDGTATCRGYRNRDAGSYEVKDGKIIITFDFCENDEPEAGWVAAEGCKYVVEMTVEGDKAEIKVKDEYTVSNLSDGIVLRR